MGHEISQFDIPDRQLLAAGAQPCVRSDIGEAKITHTIFGRARVRVVREKDKIIRAWLLAALVLIVLAAAAWQGWIAFQQSRLIAVVPPLSERISISAPVFHPETIIPSAAQSSGKVRSESLIQSEIDSLVASPNMLPQRPPNLNAAKPAVAKPLASLPFAASKSAPSATNNNLSKNQVAAQPLPKPVEHAQRATVPAVAAPPATPPAANRPTPDVLPAEQPSTRKEAVAPSSAGNNQPPDSVGTQTQASAQTQVNARGTAIIFVQPQTASQP